MSASRTVSAWSPRWLAEWSSASRRWVLWGALVTLVAALLVTLVWLAGRYEAGVLQDRIERDAVDVAADGVSAKWAMPELGW